MKKILGSLSIAALSATMATSASADVNVAYFLEWATPNQIAKVEKTYDKALGRKSKLGKLRYRYCNDRSNVIW